MYYDERDSQNEENLSFCPHCGGKIEGRSDPLKEKNEKKTKKKWVLFVCVPSGIILLIALVTFLFNNTGYRRTLNNYFKAYENSDVDLLYSSVYAQYWIDYAESGWEIDVHETLEDDIEDFYEDWDCGDDIEISYDIFTKRRASSEELEELEKTIYNRYAYFVCDRDEFSISDAYVVDVDVLIEGEKDRKMFYYDDGLLLIKENGKWKIARGDIDCSFYDN